MNTTNAEPYIIIFQGQIVGRHWSYYGARDMIGEFSNSSGRDIAEFVIYEKQGMP